MPQTNGTDLPASSVVYEDDLLKVHVVPRVDKERLPRPSVAYQDAIVSPVYRLSELMFGSLLAAYVLGFIGFAAVYSNPDLGSSGEALFLSPLILLRAPFLLISVTYAYVTAGFYVAYHAGIMTMHHMPLENLRWDFALALSQALLFGIAMLHPMLFPASLGLTLVFTVFRQIQEHRALGESFFNELGTAPQARTRKVELKTFRKKFRNLLKQEKFSLLSGWKGLSKTLLAYGLALMCFSEVSQIALNSGFKKTYVLCGFSLFTCTFVVISVHLTLGKRASLLYNRMAAMDDQFTQLVSELKKPT